MAKRVQPEDIVLMKKLYSELGSYAGVSRKVGFSSATVKRYVTGETPAGKKKIVIPKRSVAVADLVVNADYEFDLLFSERPKTLGDDWGATCELTNEERTEIAEMWDTMDY